MAKYHTCQDALLGVLLTGMVFLGPAQGSLLDPHVFPATGPFFEGWYIRVMDFSRARASVALLFGTVCPKDPSHGDKLAYIGFLHHPGGPASRIISYNAFPEINTVNITIKGGQPVNKNPSAHGLPDFKWSFENGTIISSGGQTRFRVTVERHEFSAVLENPWPWSAGGLGPEGWIGHVPYLPLHWFVYSRGSRVKEYSWKNLDTGELHSGGTENALAHVEKNWGDSFPEAWLWMQGLNPVTDSSFAFTYGPLELYSITVHGFLGGYENKVKGIHVNYTPANSRASVDPNPPDGCSGNVTLTLTPYLPSWMWGSQPILVLRISAEPSTFSRCLFGPEANGFRKVCSESFSGSATIKLYRTTAQLKKDVPFDSMAFSNCGLEFGGKYACETTCPHPDRN